MTNQEVVPCDRPRVMWRCRDRCVCGVLIELHSEDGWREFHERAARECERIAFGYRRRAMELEANARDLRELPFPTSKPRPEPSS